MKYSLIIFIPVVTISASFIFFKIFENFKAIKLNKRLKKCFEDIKDISLTKNPNFKYIKYAYILNFIKELELYLIRLNNSNLESKRLENINNKDLYKYYVVKTHLSKVSFKQKAITFLEKELSNINYETIKKEFYKDLDPHRIFYYNNLYKNHHDYGETYLDALTKKLNGNEIRDIYINYCKETINLFYLVKDHFEFVKNSNNNITADDDSLNQTRFLVMQYFINDSIYLKYGIDCRYFDLLLQAAKIDDYADVMFYKEEIKDKILDFD